MLVWISENRFQNLWNRNLIFSLFSSRLFCWRLPCQLSYRGICDPPQWSCSSSLKWNVVLCFVFFPVLLLTFALPTELLRNIYVKDNGSHHYLWPRSGSYLLSQAVSRQVSSTWRSLTSVFGMGTGGSSLLSPPDNLFRGLTFFLECFSSVRKLRLPSEYTLHNASLTLAPQVIASLLRAYCHICFANVCTLKTKQHNLWRFLSNSYVYLTLSCLRFCSAKRFGQALGLLVPVSSIHYCTSTSGLSTM